MGAEDSSTRKSLDEDALAGIIAPSSWEALVSVTLRWYTCSPSDRQSQPPTLRIRPNPPISDHTFTLTYPPRRHGCQGDSDIFDWSIWSSRGGWWIASRMGWGCSDNSATHQFRRHLACEIKLESERERERSRETGRERARERYGFRFRVSGFESRFSGLGLRPSDSGFGARHFQARSP